MAAMFEVMTKANSAAITLYDMHPSGAVVHPETWVIGRDPKAVYWAILCFAKKHGLAPVDVGYSIVFDDTGGANG